MGLGLFAFIGLLILAPILFAEIFGAVLGKVRDVCAVIVRENKLTNIRQTHFALKDVF